MKRIVKWLVAIVVVPFLLLVCVAAALQYWVGSDDFRGRVSQQASSALGVPVVLGRITVDVWPLPAVGLDQVQVKSQPPLALERVEARPSWAPLLQGRLEIATLIVRNAVVPEQAVAAIAAAYQRAHPAPKARGDSKAPGASMALMPRRTVLEQVTWVHAKGGSTTVDAQAVLDDDGLPATATLAVRKGRFEGASAKLERRSDHWALRAEIGGGSVIGKLQFQPAAGKNAPLLQGQLNTTNVEVAALTAPSRVLTGRLDAQTILRASLRDPGALADALQTQSRFTVRNAVVHGLDLAQAVKSVGLNRGGETRLDTLTGNVVTQGRNVQLNNLVAKSGALSANGSVAMAANRSLGGNINVELASVSASGPLAVPLVVGGTVDSPSVMPTRSALLGAAAGVLAPRGGASGSGSGANLGDRLGEGLRGLFGK
jgi:hypothetical protein